MDDDDIMIIDDPAPAATNPLQPPDMPKQDSVLADILTNPTSTYGDTKSLNDTNLESRNTSICADASAKIRTNYCLNKVCRISEGLSQATLSTVSYFEKNPVESRKYYVCDKCLQASEEYEKELVKLLINGDNIMCHSIERPCDLVDLDLDDEEIEDSKSDVKDEGEDDYESFLVDDDVDQLIDDLFVKYKCEDQINEGIRMTKEKLKDLEDRQKNLDDLTKSFQKEIDELSRTFYGAFEPNIKHLPELDIDNQRPLPVVQRRQDVQRQTHERNNFTVPRQRPPERMSDAEVNSRKQGAAVAASLLKGRVDPSSVSNRPSMTNRSPSSSPVKARPSAAEAPEIEAINHSRSQSKVKLPPSGPLERPEPQIGDYVFVMTMTLRDTWKRAKVCGKEEKDGIIFYRVKVHENLKRTVIAKHLSYYKPAEVLIPHGTRIIAMYKDENDACVGYYAGIIAENLKHINNFRYLIFFDDGFAQYSVHSDVRVVCEQSPEVWNDLEVEARSFTQTYLQQYPERPMVKLQPGQIVKTEFNKRWYVARVQAVDASLAQLSFQNCDGRVEWIYRGSTRLAPLYNELIQRPKAQQKLQANAPKAVTEMLSAKNSKEDDQSVSVRAVAKKSTSKKPSQIVDESIEKLDRVSSRQKISSEHDGKVQAVRNVMPVSEIRFTRHQCGPPCIKFYEYDPEREPKWKRMNQLLIPMQLGWARKIVGIHLQSNKPKVPSDVVIYRAPCGRHLRSPEDVLRYLRVTHSTMPIDMFTFDVAVRTNVEFTPSKVLWEHVDISYGKEPMPVSAVNSIDRTAPDYVAYSTVRIPSRGVKMNLDPNFLSCCSCKDDCQNRDKCECQQLTVKGLSKAERILISNAGYQYRRLSEQIVTGVYECNERCPCKKTCLNRVVQFPLKVRLQLFKTDKRGWGIRTLDDLPSGAFICVYAGQLLTDQEANQEGITAGDEYFADLDFIEVAEKVKEGYESDVEMSEDDFEEPKGAKKDASADLAAPLVVSVAENSDSSLRRSTREKKKPSNEIQEQPKKKKGKRGKKGKNQSVLQSETENNGYRIKYVPTRELFGKDELAYTMDAKTVGNIGRYLNHSCNPNVFVQNVFVDTHDLRFPWVAFFANSHIAAGSELMWDYSYEVDSVPGKKLLCHCGAENCRGRLL